MKKVTVNGKTYFGNITKKGNSYKLTEAMEIGSGGTKGEMNSYFMQKNAGELTSVKFGGKGTSFSISELTERQKLYVEVCKTHMAYAKKTAVNELVNQAFAEALGKL